jgi:prepilin peptidase CpaA
MPSDLVIAHLATLALAAGLLALAAWHDTQTYRIPNWASLSLLLLFPIFALTAARPVPWVEHIAIFALVLAAGFLMFAKQIAGAGDIKLLAVTSLWAGPQLIALFLFITAITGGLLGLAVAALTWHRNRQAGSPKMAIPLAKKPIPYGVAIAIGGFCLLLSIYNQLQIPDLWSR